VALAEVAAPAEIPEPPVLVDARSAPPVVGAPAPVAAVPAPIVAAPADDAPRTGTLRSGLHNPMPGGLLAGYAADTGLDIAGSPRPVFAIAAGTLDYSEAGHTLWTGPRDSHFTIRFALDAPIEIGNHKVTHVYYGHLSRLAYEQHEGATERRHVAAGEFLGISGVARGSPHLHVGLLLDGQVEQDWGTFLLEDDVRKILGPYRNGVRLPDDAARAAFEPKAERRAASALRSSL
jgi:murein DD-endopeptidase MepM/ murein hydrolase activator NlpD